MKTVSIANAEHYVWSEACDGWHLLKNPDSSIIQERVPAGGAEILHLHRKSRQFFYVLKGVGVIKTADSAFTLQAGEGLEIPPGTAHQFRNESTEDVLFLVISIPPSHQDRININS